ncbi:hypothetical protein VTO73DRAFT_1159 [Trametes versicolor]
MALTVLYQNSSLCKMTKLLTKLVDGHTQRVLELSTFGSKVDISVEDWHEAWKNFLRMLPCIVGSLEAECWREHYDHLTDHKDFCKDFHTLILFDIQLHTIWFNAESTRVRNTTAGMTRTVAGGCSRDWGYNHN